MSRQYLIPNQGYLNESKNIQYLIPRWGFINDTSSSGSFTSSGALIESSDVIGGSVLSGNTTSGTLLESSDIISGNVSGAFSYGSLIESSDVIASNVTSDLGASGSLLEDSDVIAGSVVLQGGRRQFFIPNWGYTNQTRANSYLVPNWGYLNENIPTTVLIGGTLLESSDIISSNVEIANAFGSLLESSDIITVNVTVSYESSGNLIEDSDVIGGNIDSSSPIVGSLIESSDIISSYASSGFNALGSLVEGSDIINCLVTNTKATPASRIINVIPTIVNFVYGAENYAQKTPTEIDKYTFDYTIEIDGDTMITSGWNAPNSDLTIINLTPNYVNNISQVQIGGGTVGNTEVINLVDTLGQRQLEQTAQFEIRDYNFALALPLKGGVSDILDYAFNWIPRFQDENEYITDSSWTYTGTDTALNIGFYSPFIFGGALKTGVWVTGGTYNNTYIVTNTITTSLGRVLQSSFIYFINQPEVIVSPYNYYITEDGDYYVTETGDNYIA